MTTAPGFTMSAVTRLRRRLPHEDICLSRDCWQVARAAMRNRHRGIGRKQQHCHRLAHMLERPRTTACLLQRQCPCARASSSRRRGAGAEMRHAHQRQPGIGGMQPIDILVERDPFKNSLRIEVAGKRQLHEDPCTPGRRSVDRCARELGLEVLAGRRSAKERMPTSSQPGSCCGRKRGGGIVTDQHDRKAGGCPLPWRARCARQAGAYGGGKALPSMRRAVMADNLSSLTSGKPRSLPARTGLLAQSAPASTVRIRSATVLALSLSMMLARCASTVLIEMRGHRRSVCSAVRPRSARAPAVRAP